MHFVEPEFISHLEVSARERVEKKADKEELRSKQTKWSVVCCFSYEQEKMRGRSFEGRGRPEP